MKQNNSRFKKTVIGLTGNSGAGKTSVSKILAEHGAYIIDTDSLNHKLLEPGQKAFDEIVAVFGKEILKKNGDIDRKVLGEIVFADVSQRLRLEEICHRHIWKETLEIIERLEETDFAYIVIDAPLLFEAGMEKIAHSVWIILADKKTRMQRISLRDRLKSEEILARFQAQNNMEKWFYKADVLIQNDGLTLYELEKEVLKHLNLLHLK